MQTIKVRSPETIPGAILQRKDLTLTAKRVYSQIRFTQSHRAAVCIDLGWLSGRLSITRQAASRAVQILEQKKLLSVSRRPHRPSIYSAVKLELKKFFLFLYNPYDSGHCISSMLLLSYLKFRQGENEAAWPHLQTICDDLGLSRAKVCRLLFELETAGLIAIDRANGGRKQGNRYYLAADFCISEQDTRSESRVSKRDSNNNTSEEIKEPDTSGISSKPDLSNTRRLLVDYGVSWAAAESLAVRHDRQSIEAAVLNAVGQGRRAARSGRMFKTAAYIVGTLNRARIEGHGVVLNGFMLAEKELWDLSRGRPEAAIVSRAAVLDELRARKRAMQDGSARRNVPDGIRKMLGVCA
jgi:DNA-binding MarR family transcriptional regulator